MKKILKKESDEKTPIWTIELAEEINEHGDLEDRTPMNYCITYYDLEEAEEAANELVEKYREEPGKFEVNIFEGEYELPGGDIYGEPYVIETIKTGMDNPYGPENLRESRNDDWFGIKGAKFIYHGDWDDPEVQYDGVSLNYYDVEDILLDEYREGHPEDRNDKGFDKWMAEPSQKPSIQSALDILVQGGCGKPLDDGEDSDIYDESETKRYKVDLDTDFFDKFVDEIDIADYWVDRKDNSLVVTDGEVEVVVPAEWIENWYGCVKGSVIWKIGKDAGPKGDRVTFEK